MIDHNFIYLGFLLNLYGGLDYVVQTLRGKTKPNRVSWLIWALAPFLTFAAEIKQGVGLASLMTFSAGFNPFLIFIASFINKKAEWKLSLLDYVCGGLALSGLLLWYLTQDANVAILFGVLADGLGAVPTIVKSYSYPETESSKVFLYGGINAVIALLVIDQWDFAHYAFPLYIFFVCALLVALIHFKLGKVIHSWWR